MALVQITIYETATGEITETSTYDEPDAPVMDAGFSFIAGLYSPKEFYVSGGVAVERPEIVQDGAIFAAENNNVVVTLITGMPIGTLVTCDPSDLEFTSTIVEDLQIQSELDGVYTFEVIPPFPYQDATITVNIGAV